MSNIDRDHEQGLEDVQQLGLFAAIGSLGYVFWVVGGMEMIERLAYYGVRAVSGLYATAPLSEGGLGVSAVDLGSIFFIWALFQSLVPALIGGLSDRLGYKLTIFISTVVKIVAYLIMAFYPSYEGFVIGAIILATGTGIFKPGIQGTLVKTTNRENSSMAWGIFYQTVNIGGWMGPLLAAQLRQLAWSNLFFACAAIISINFLLLLIYKEPNIEERLERKRSIEAGETNQENLIWESLKELAQPTLWVFLVIMMGFWFMFNALFDVLPLYIRDWVNTATIVQDLFGPGGTSNSAVIFLLGMSNDGLRIMPEGLLNLNAALIMITCFLFAQLSGKLRAINSMIVGTLMTAVAFFLIGWTSAAWACLIGILVFSVGEMLSSPKFLEYIGNIAPSDKKAMYLGFSNLPLAVGWVLEGYFGPLLYGTFAAKETLAREWLATNGMTGDTIAAIPQGEAFQHMVEFAEQPAEVLTQMLYQANSVGVVWDIMAVIAIISAVGLFFYGRWILSITRTFKGVASPA
ncbi:MAG: MFS transporter [Gammaproteobacteria bacterium]|nr:MFS transporter [Gammaproteobacteria bacterium]